MIRDVLTRHDYNRTKTAEELGMHKTTLWRKMKKLGISEKSVSEAVRWARKK